MDKIARIRAEIERRMKIYKKSNYGISLRYQELEELHSFIDTLEEESDKSLEEAAENIYKVPFGTRAEDFIAGAEWQKQQDLAEMAQSKSPLSVAYANRCFENGKQAMKEQMLKEAVEVTVENWNSDPHPEVTIPLNSDEFIAGDKVRIIVMKEEE